jgi:hypothetical protein
MPKVRFSPGKPTTPEPTRPVGGVRTPMVKPTQTTAEHTFFAPGKHDPNLQHFEIWSEGYGDGTGEGATYHGSAPGKDFRAACARFAELVPAFSRHFDCAQLTFWGCRLFDNAEDARRSYG